MDDADALIVERIAEAVVRKIDERDKINLLADAVLQRLQEMQRQARVPGEQGRSARPRRSRAGRNGGA